jgi:site-specific DNA-cytosine methylase
MGLPGDWTKYGLFSNKIVIDPDEGIKEISDSQRYKLCGNGVVVNVIEKIIETLILKQGAYPD